jgi:hypothetical protein
MNHKFLGLLSCLFILNGLTAQDKTDKFAQLYDKLPTPNVYRTASGAPGHQYWQQRADYDMRVELDDEKQRIYGDETITYYNNSPDQLSYLWLQLDQNLFAEDSDGRMTKTGKIDEKMSFNTLREWHKQFDGGFKIDHVKDATGKDLKFTIVGTMMRVDLPQVLPAGKNIQFKVKWWYNINDGGTFGGRCGYEYFPKDENYLYSIAQYYPRMCAYTDNEGWQHKQYLGSGEFTLSFGNYTVAITVPDDHIVAATGTLQNTSTVLTAEQRKRYEQSQNATEPVMIVTQAEATEKEKTKSKTKKTWIFKADNVRDFAFASSRKFIWDAMGVQLSTKKVMAMSYYPKECNPLWEQFSTKAVAHTLRVYSKFTFDYPYPQATSTHAAFTGMEYPMICFNFGRPEEDGTYSERIKYGMIGVVIHEVGHNYFPMIVNSDERQWTWMDEGLNSFLEYLTEVEWDRNFPTRRGPAFRIVDYMKGSRSGLEPIMTNSESITQFGNNGYGKPAAALNILRETILGREKFDFAFKEYANRWKFKHPSPADFFRTMEDASGVDLDWFWRGWFFGIDHVDISIEDVKLYQLNTKNPDVEKPLAEQKENSEELRYISNTRNKEEIKQTYVEADPKLQDFYHTYNPFKVDALDRKDYEKFVAGLSKDEKALIEAGHNYYQVDFKNKGGLVMPIIIQFNYTDGTSELYRIPAEIWRYNNDAVSKVFITKKTAASIELDPFLETADCDTENNYFPQRETPSRFQMFKGGGYGPGGENPMQRAKKLGN